MSDQLEKDKRENVVSAEGQCPVRRFPLRRPEGHEPPIARYSALLPQTSKIAVLFLGLQSKDRASLQTALTECMTLRTVGTDAPVYSDHAEFVDKQGYLNHVIAFYWFDDSSFKRWSREPIVADWRTRQAVESGVGIWWEPIVTNAERAETITFKEFRRGFSGCPAALQPTEGSGYWGAARDRIPSSADDLFESTLAQDSFFPALRDGSATYRAIRPAKNMAIIRSGVSWEKCEGEQLDDYIERIKPKLDQGMSHLRDHPRETGCFALRQVTAVEPNGVPLKEAYSLGTFVSLRHLEDWAEHHPTHLAIYTRAIASRRKYQDALQLRTYNEIFIVDDDNPPFEYYNCHPQTGLLPYSI